MSSVWGNNIKLSIFGEAQGEVFGELYMISQLEYQSISTALS